MITIAAALMDQITQAAERAYPDECCGMLAGIDEADGGVRISRVAASANVAEGRQRDRFEVDPKVRFDLMRQIEGGPERIIGHYHSHPDHPARPSEHDVKMAFEPDLLWLIIGLKDGRTTNVTAHKIVEEQAAFQEIPLTVA